MLHAFNLDSFLIAELKIILQVRINISSHQQKRFNSKFMSSTNNLKLTTITDIVINLPGVMKRALKYFCSELKKTELVLKMVLESQKWEDKEDKCKIRFKVRVGI